jgi:hypothetical protein
MRSDGRRADLESAVREEQSCGFTGPIVPATGPRNDRRAWSSSWRRRVRAMAEPFVLDIRQNLAGRTGALGDLAIGPHGLSTRDIEDAFTDEAGRR